MNILAFDDVDPFQAFNLTLLAMDYPLTPERAAEFRRTDPCTFPCFALYAVQAEQVLGMAGLLRLPMLGTEGPEDVGGLWALAIHPHHARREVTSALLEAAHAQMRSAGLRFAVVVTERSRTAFQLYQRHGYVDMRVWARALARWETAHQPTRLRAWPASHEGLEWVETLFSDLAGSYLGFTRRHMPSALLRDKARPEGIWLVGDTNAPVGILFAHREGALLEIHIHLLRLDIDAVEAVAAVASNLQAPYVQVGISRPADIAGLQRAGWQVTHPDRASFMIRPLVPAVTAGDARRLFGIGTDRFLISWRDMA